MALIRGLVFCALIMAALGIAAVSEEDNEFLGSVSQGRGEVMLLSIDVYSDHLDADGWAYYTGSYAGTPFQNLTTFDSDAAKAGYPDISKRKPLGTVERLSGNELFLSIDVYEEHVSESGWAYYSGECMGNPFEVWVTFDPENSLPMEDVVDDFPKEGECCQVDGKSDKYWVWRFGAHDTLSDVK
ncbi:hypothetical protein J7K50_06930 [bacterium]|nr:hypothetical protein [bacterium]